MKISRQNQTSQSIRLARSSAQVHDYFRQGGYIITSVCCDARLFVCLSVNRIMGKFESDFREIL